MRRGQDLSHEFPGLVVVHHNKPGMEAARHHHADHHLILPLQGEAKLQLDGGKSLVCGPGRMIYVAPGDEHSFASASDKGERLIALITPAAWRRAKGGVFTSRVLPTHQLVKEFLFYLIINAKTRHATALIQVMIGTLCESLETNPHIVPNQSYDHRTALARRPEIAKALAFLDENFHETVAIPELAKKSGMSVRNFNRAFFESLGMTPRQYLVQARLARAQEMLRSGQSVTETAMAVGYSSLSAFIQAFRAGTGQIPSSVRG